MSQIESLRALLVAGGVMLVPYAPEHAEALRAACAEDREIWHIYPHSMLGEHFEPAMAVRQGPTWVSFTALLGGQVVGTTAYIRPDPANGTVEIGGTYFAPRVRGTGYNHAAKKLMIEHAFAQGYRRIAFLVDERNRRSLAAVLKLGAVREGMLRQDRITWTGHLRNTCLFGLLREEWAG